MGPALNQQIRDLRGRAARYRKIGELLGDTAASAKLNQWAAELDHAIDKLKIAHGAIEGVSHHSWAELSVDTLMPKLRAQIALTDPGQGAAAEQWRELSRLWVEEAESAGNHHDRQVLAGWAFEVAQLAEAIARHRKDAGADFTETLGTGRKAL